MRGDGRELFYLAPDGTMMAVDIRAGTTIEPGTPYALFRTGVQTSFNVDQYAVSADPTAVSRDEAGRRKRTTPMTVVFDWPALLKRR